MAPTLGPGRRAVLRGSVLAASPLLSSAAHAASKPRGLAFATLGEAMKALDRLGDATALPPPTAFGWAQTLVHCAQSIEYSMTGYPQSKSALFQRTVGAAAFAWFSWRGRMSHDLGEPIPGAPPLDGAELVQAEARLRRAVRDFEAWSGPLRPHFAYGELAREDYARAHAMHLADHFSAFARRG